MARCIKCDEYARKNRLPFPPPYDADEVDPELRLCFACAEEQEKVEEDKASVAQ